MYPDVPDNLEEGVRHQPEGEAQALQQEKVQLEQEKVQPGGANIVEGPGEIHNYATKLGIVHIVCGVINMLVVSILPFVAGGSSPFVAIRFLPSVFFFVSGSVAIQGAFQRSRCLVSIGQTLSILSAIVAILAILAILIPSPVTTSAFAGGYSLWDVQFGRLFLIILIYLVMVTMLIVATISAILPCLIEAPQGNVTKVQDNASPASGSALMKNYAILGMNVVHLICGWLLVLADMISTRQVGVGLTFPPGTLTSVGILLLASSVLSLANQSLANQKRRSKLLFLSAVVPTVYAAVSVGIILFISLVTIPANRGYNGYGYDYGYNGYNGYYNGYNDNTPTGFPIGLAIFGALALMSTTTASAILSSQFLGTNSSDKILV